MNPKKIVNPKKTKSIMNPKNPSRIQRRRKFIMNPKKKKELLQ
jgi:hypothetical protein